MLMTVSQASKKYFNNAISVTTLYKLIKDNQIPVVRITPKMVLLDDKQLDEWVIAKSNIKEVIKNLHIANNSQKSLQQQNREVKKEFETTLASLEPEKVKAWIETMKIETE